MQTLAFHSNVYWVCAQSTLGKVRPHGHIVHAALLIFPKVKAEDIWCVRPAGCLGKYARPVSICQCWLIWILVALFTFHCKHLICTQVILLYRYLLTKIALTHKKLSPLAVLYQKHRYLELMFETLLKPRSWNSWRCPVLKILNPSWS